MINPLTEATGPEFLALFAILIGVVAFVCWWRQRARDTSAELSPLPSARTPDPYEIAYLRGGDNELTRVLIVSLTERNYLKVTAQGSRWWKSRNRYIERVTQPPSPTSLTPLELAAFNWFERPRTAESVFRGASGTLRPEDLPSALRMHSYKYEQKLRTERLLTSDDHRDEAYRDIAAGIGFVMAIGLARLFIGVSHSRPVGFLVLMGLVGAIAIVMLGLPGRLSRRGKNYLDATQRSWSWLKSSSDNRNWNASLAAALFGFTVLSETEMSPLYEMFPRGNRNPWSGDGSGGCGAGCGGGGCGGCGGCGG